MKTLLLERDATQREAIAQHLHARGHIVMAHDDWAAVSTIIEDQPIHLAILEWGPEAEHWIMRSKAHENAMRMMIVAVITDDRLAQLEHIFDVGANDYLVRPLGQPAHVHRLLQFEYRLRGWARILETHGISNADYLRAAVEHSGDIIEITDLHAHYLYVNPSFTSALGYTFPEVLGRTPAELLRAGHHPPEYYREIERVIMAGGVWRGDITSRAKDGRTVHFDATVMGIKDVTGEVVRHVSVKRDITARRLAEERVREARAHLHATVSSLADAVISLNRESIVLLANPAAQTIAWVPGGLLVGQHLDQVLHLIDEDTGRRIDHPIAELMHRDARAARMTRFAAIDHRGRRHPVHPTVTPLRDEAGADIGAVLVLRDMTQARRIDEALAAKAMAEAASHYKSVFLATVSHDLRTPMNGVMGMAALLEQTALDEQQVDLLATLRRSSEDLLALIDELLDTARDVLAPHVDTDDPPVESSDAAIQYTTTPRQAEPSVLVVDDNAINRKVARHMLEGLSVRCQEAQDGYDAVDQATGLRYDLILMDCHMPGMSGLEATRLIRDFEQRIGRRTPIVALTADGAYHDRARCVGAGMDDYMSKPLRPRQLEAMLRAWRVLPLSMATKSGDEVI